MKEEIRAFTEAHKEEAIKLLETLGKIPAPSHKEDKRAAFVKSWLEGIGYENVVIDDAKNVVVRLEVHPSEKFHVYMAHTDVVFEDETELPMTRDGNILRAPGIGDDTANLVNLLMGAKFVREHLSLLNHNLMIVANSCEEGLGNLDGAKQIFADHGHEIDAFISFDGYLGGIVKEPVGSHRYRVTIKTQGGHSYGNFGRDNAIELAAWLIERLYKIQVPEQAYTTYNVGVISGGSTVNSIAQECSFLYEYRSADNTCLDIMKKAFEDVIQTMLYEGKDVEAELLGVRPGMGDMDLDALERFTERNKDLLEDYWQDEIHILPGSTDANVPLSLGVIANTIGTVSGKGAHTREEWVDLNSLPTGMALVMNYLKEEMK